MHHASVQKNELDTKSILNIIDDITEAGCLQLLLTGGEPLLHADFETIYLHAKHRGLIVTVFSNGSTITDKNVQLFKKFPPSMIEISLYGTTPETYKLITGVSESYKQTIAGIDRLHKSGVRFNLKTILMDLNILDLQSMKQMAQKLGVSFRFDAQITPRTNGDQTPLQRRVNPKEAIELEFLDDENVENLKKFWDKQKLFPPNDKLYKCGAGLRTFHITSNGILQPCISAQTPSCNLKKTGFLDGWQNELIKISEFTIPKDSSCRDCNLTSLCGYCPPLFENKCNKQDSQYEFMCRLAELRYMKLTQ
jgi:radical SAM protein with 4Fe4S-binding SPASM domain